MYKGFNLNLTNWDNEYYNTCLKFGRALYFENFNKVNKKVESFKNSDGSLNGSKMKANWFPTIDSNVFISHSHKDLDMALAFSGYLMDNFELKTFIDSCAWSFVDDLLKLIDQEYCYLDKKNNIFDYGKRNYSTSHAHMMLSTAILTMIDKTECLFFLNTPNSITPENVINQTVSPWIYSEIVATQLIREKSAHDHRNVYKAFSNSYTEDSFPDISYDVDLCHLTEINNNTLEDWMNNNHLKQDEALDYLYKITLDKESLVLNKVLR
jgi:hypothetical protein